MKKKACILIYGRGGHQEQMRRLLARGLFKPSDQVTVIALTDSNRPLHEGIDETYRFREFRDKHSNWRTLLYLPGTVLRLSYVSLMLVIRYSILGSVTTGPGLGILPSLILRVFGKKMVVFETWSKFYEPTFTTRVLSKFNGLLIIQNESLRSIYPKARFWGRL